MLDCKIFRQDTQGTTGDRNFIFELVLLGWEEGQLRKPLTNLSSHNTKLIHHYRCHNVRFVSVRFTVNLIDDLR